MRNLKKSEEIILLVLTAALIGLFYYQFVYKGVLQAREEYDTTILETQLTGYQARLASMQQMEKAIASGKDSTDGIVATYNNQKQEIIALNNIFADADSFDLSFAEPYAVDGDNTVRRNLSASFTAESYDKAKEMLTALYHCEYRCLIQDINITPTGGNSQEEASLSSGPVQVSLTATFYETMYNAASTYGINIEDAGN